MADNSYHDRRLSRRLQEDPEFRAEYELQRQQIAEVDDAHNQPEQPAGCDPTFEK